MKMLPIASRRLTNTFSVKSLAPLSCARSASSKFASGSQNNPFLTRVYNVNEEEAGDSSHETFCDFKNGSVGVCAAGVGVKSFYVNRDDEDDDTHEKRKAVAEDDEAILSPRSALRRRLSREITFAHCEKPNDVLAATDATRNNIRNEMKISRRNF